MLLRMGEVDGLIGSRGSNVELGIEDVDARRKPAQPRHRKRIVALVLPGPILAALPKH